MKNKSVTCIIIDDEPFAVKLLEDYASKIPQLDVRFSGTDVFQAINILNSESIDLVFVDIQMPQLTGIELMELFNKKHNFIITSAYQEYALDSFRFHVIDFLLKPITFNRFYQSVDKFINWKNTFNTCENEDYLLVKSDRKLHKIATESIIYIEGLKDYIRIHTSEEKIIVLENMKDILEKLPQKRFIRVHRSYIIATNQIKLIEGNRIQLHNKEFIPIGETYRKMVDDWFKIEP